MCVARDGLCGQRLQLWSLDPHPWLEGVLAEAAAAAHAVAVAVAPAAPEAEAEPAAAAASTARTNAEADADVDEPAGSAWRQVQGAAFELPGTVAGLDIAVAPNQVRAGRQALRVHGLENIIGGHRAAWTLPSTAGCAI